VGSPSGIKQYKTKENRASPRLPLFFYRFGRGRQGTVASTGGRKQTYPSGSRIVRGSANGLILFAERSIMTYGYRIAGEHRDKPRRKARKRSSIAPQPMDKKTPPRKQGISAR
jgi:hypothetical protein